MIFARVAKVGINEVFKRFTKRKVNLKAWPNNWVPFIWNRPKTEPGYYNSGDLVGYEQPSEYELLPENSKSKLLNQLDLEDPIRKIFSSDHAITRDKSKALVHKHIKELGLIHEIDHSNSLEAKIINLTFKLRSVQEYVQKTGETNRYNGQARTLANSLKYRRYRYLCDLKEQHADRYERIKKALNIEPKNNLINVPYFRPYRKVQMRRLAIEYARDLKEKKVQEFMKSLEQEKADFEEYKKDTSKWIEEQEKKLGITV